MSASDKAWREYRDSHELPELDRGYREFIAGWEASERHWKTAIAEFRKFAAGISEKLKNDSLSRPRRH